MKLCFENPRPQTKSKNSTKVAEASWQVDDPRPFESLDVQGDESGFHLQLKRQKQPCTSVPRKRKADISHHAQARKRRKNEDPHVPDHESLTLQEKIEAIPEAKKCRHEATENADINEHDNEMKTKARGDDKSNDQQQAKIEALDRDNDKVKRNFDLYKLAAKGGENFYVNDMAMDLNTSVDRIPMDSRALRQVGGPWRTKPDKPAGARP